MSVRLFFFLLVFANLLFYAWAQGYFGASDENREPQRLAGQLHAEKLHIVSSQQMAKEEKQPLACRVINGLSQPDAEKLLSAVKTGGGTATILAPANPKPYLVVVTDLASKTVAEKRMAELVRSGVTEQRSVELEGGQYEIVLGSFSTETAAREMLKGLVKQGIRSARVDNREQPQQVRVEVRGPAAELLRQLPLLIAPHADATIGDCPS